MRSSIVRRLIPVILALSALASGTARPAVAAPVEPPVLLSPADTAVTNGRSDPPAGTPLLTWAPVSGAQRYQVQVSTSSGFAAPLIAQETYANNYAPIIALADGMYFWRVRAFDGKEWGAYCDAWSFTKDWSAGATLVPELLTPANGETRAAFRPDDFTWTSVTGAATYRFEISLDPEFSAPLYTATTLTTRHTPTIRLDSNTYYWRVTPYDNRGQAGGASATGEFTFDWGMAPQLLAPEANVTLQFLPRFSWTAVEAGRQYRLQISTQPDFGSTVTTYLSDHTDYTPEQNLPNDKDYYWRVQAVDQFGITGPWSEVRRFRMQWYFEAQLLTPLNNAIHTSYPFFSWAPIPGAQQYQVQIDESTSFDDPIADVKIYNVTTYAQPEWENVSIDGDYYWRVRGVDARGNVTPWSVTRTFRPSYDNTSTQVYPLYYYVPDDAQNPVHADRTVASPVFVWDTAHRYDPSTGLTEATDYYELAVDDDPGFSSPNFTLKTAGLGAAPTSDHPFDNLVDGGIYYWRVRAYRDGKIMGADQPWVARINTRLQQLPSGTEPEPIYPADGFEAVGAPPVLGWTPAGAGGPYEIQIATDEGFAQVVDEATAAFMNYVPWQGRQVGMPFGAYWWRVRRAGGQWSAGRRFNLAVDVIAGNPYDAVPAVESILNRTTRYTPGLSRIDASPAEPGAGAYDLTALHVMLNRVMWPAHPRSYNLNWVFAFQSAAAPGSAVSYGLYIDVDHRQDSGSNTDPEGRPITVDRWGRPEYALYLRSSATMTATASSFYRWNGTGWDPPQTLWDIGGDSWYDAGQRAVQILLPYSSVGAADTGAAGSLALTVFTVGSQDRGGVHDTIPEQVALPQGVTLNRPAFVSDMLMPLYPFDTPLTNPTVHFDMPTLRWRMPYNDSVDGYQVEVARDAKFTQIAERWETYEAKTWPYYALMPAAFATQEAYEDNESYYWRVRIRHERYVAYPASFFDYGPWSPPMRFKLDSRQPADLQLSTGQPADTTPTFSWDRVEGAAGYSIQIDNDANFSSPVLAPKFDGSSYTPLDTLPDGAYYWRVAMRRSSTVVGHWSTPLEFTKQSLTPAMLAPATDVQIPGQPDFAWAPLLAPSEQPRIAGPRYRLQWATDPNFSSPKQVDTSATAFTPAKGLSLADGGWYWRVAVMDANGKIGVYSKPQRFYKEYRPPALLSPGQGQVVPDTPVYRWEPYDGAAWYEVQIADNELFNRAKTVKTDNTTFIPTDKLTGKAYYWRVRIYDADGKPGPYRVGRVQIGARTYLPVLQN